MPQHHEMDHEKRPAPGLHHPDHGGELGADIEAVLAQRKTAEKRLVRKMDAVLMPLLSVTLGLQYYDKAALGSAAAFGILKDLVSVCMSWSTWALLEMG